MKVLNYVCRIVTLLLGVAALILFFFPFTTLPAASAIDVSGAQLAFGTTVKDSSGSYDLYLSSYYLLTFLLTAFATVFGGVAVFTKKSAKGFTVTSFISSFIAGIIMLVISLSKVTKFADYRPVVLQSEAGIVYKPIVLIVAIVILAMFVVGVIGWLVNDYVEVLASSGRKLTIKQKVVKFIREMVVEIKKIIWPTPKTVVRNSVIVLILCAILGAFVWVADYLLGLLVGFIAGL